MRLRYAASIMLLVTSSPALAANFSCRNTGAEITCNKGKCEINVNDGFTPMSVSRTGQMLEVCAYSGCASGPITIRRNGGPMEILYAEVRWQNTDGSLGKRDPLAVIYDRTSHTAIMHWGSYSNAMDCTLS